MKERPILFSSAMVNAILEGRKSVTRRIVKPQPTADSLPGYVRWKDGHFNLEQYPNDSTMLRHCPYGQGGDELWVRESFRYVWQCGSPHIEYLADGHMRHAHEIDEPGGMEFPDGSGDPPKGWERNRPSIFMPRWASRITLRITSVKVERLLQEITDEEALREGIEEFEYTARRLSPCVPHAPDEGHEVEAVRYGTEMLSLACMATTPRIAFRNLWQSINGQREGCDWNSNPWVWAVGVEMVSP